jgi:hypothetical protein
MRSEGSSITGRWDPREFAQRRPPTAPVRKSFGRFNGGTQDPVGRVRKPHRVGLGHDGVCRLGIDESLLVV